MDPINLKTGEASGTYYFKIKNNSPYDVEISSAYLLKGNKFKLNSTSYPLTISANGESTTDISCYLITDKDGYFDDQLVLNVTEPCPQDYFSEQFKGYVYDGDPIILYVHLPDTTADVGEYFRMPLKAKLSEPAPEGMRFDLKVTWHYFADVYSTAPYQVFDSETAYNLDSLYINEFVTGTFKNLELDTVYKKIADVTGVALLNKLDYTPLSFDVENPFSTVNQYGYIIVGEDGSLTTQKPSCLSSDIKMNSDITHAVVANISPMNTESYLNAYSPCEGKLKLRVFNLQGELIEEFEFDNTGIFNQEIYLTMSKYANGMYFLSWIGKDKTYRSAIIISK